MAKDLKGTKTEKNLQDAFAGESMARNKYTYYASKAKAEGYNQISNLFEETANNEKEHAKMWFKLLHAGEVPTTAQNLADAAEGEHYENTVMYPTMKADAEEEGFSHIAALFGAVAKIEQQHELRYLALLDNVKNNRVFQKTVEVTWECANCGHIHIGTSALQVCPVCAHPQAHYQILAKNY